MKCLIAFAALLAVSSAQFRGFQQQRPVARAPQGYRPVVSAPQAYRPVVSAPQAYRPVAARSSAASDQAASIVRYENDVAPDGSFQYLVETDNGISAQAQGTPRNLGGNPPEVPVVIQGSYSYSSPEGVPVSITYVADENGYQPQGDSIPTPPPVPEAIQRALEWIARNPQRK